MTLQISNREARRLWLSHQGLAETSTGALCQRRLMSIIEGLGFVQLDTIRIIDPNWRRRHVPMDTNTPDRLHFPNGGVQFPRPFATRPRG